MIGAFPYKPIALGDAVQSWINMLDKRDEEAHSQDEGVRAQRNSRCLVIARNAAHRIFFQEGVVLEPEDLEVTEEIPGQLYTIEMVFGQLSRVRLRDVTQLELLVGSQVPFIWEGFHDDEYDIDGVQFKTLVGAVVYATTGRQ